MKRRDVIRRGAAVAATAMLGGAAGCAAGTPSGEGPAVQARRRIRWRLASSFPRALDTLFGGAEVLAETLGALTDGRFEIRPSPAGELVPGLQVLDAVQQGSIEVGQSASYYYTGKNPALAFDACVPFGLPARLQEAWLREGGGRELMDELFDDFGVVSFGAGNTGTQMGGWFRKPVEGLTDLRGLRMRIPGMGGEVMARLGVNVQVLAGGEIQPALERGAIDATEWVGPHDDLRLGFHRVARHYHYPGWWEPGPSLSFYVGRRAWDGLPAAWREAFRAATVVASQTMLARYDVLNPRALAEMRANGVELLPFPRDVMTAAHATSEELLEEHASREPAFRRVLEHWDAFRRDAFAWFSTAEHGYSSFIHGEDV